MATYLVFKSGSKQGALPIVAIHEILEVSCLKETFSKDSPLFYHIYRNQSLPVTTASYWLGEENLPKEKCLLLVLRTPRGLWGILADSAEEKELNPFPFSPPLKTSPFLPPWTYYASEEDNFIYIADPATYSGNILALKNIAPSAHSLLNFWVIGSLEFPLAVDLLQVVNLIPCPLITSVPRAFSGLLGIANHKGQILPILDINPMLSLTPLPFSRINLLLLVSYRDLSIGIAFDEVLETYRLSFEDLHPLPTSFPSPITKASHRALQWNKRLVPILNLEKLLDGALVDSTKHAILKLPLHKKSPIWTEAKASGVEVLSQPPY